MKKLTANFKLVFIFIVLLTLCFCKDDDDSCKNEIVDFDNIENIYECENTMWNFTLSINEGYVIVKNQEEFVEYVNTSGCSLQIDFNKYDLVIGTHYVSPQTTFNYEVINNCEGNYLYIFVKLNNNQPEEIEYKAVYHVLIPKLENGKSIQVNFGT